MKWWTWCFCLNEMSSNSFRTRYFSDICCNETNLKVSTLVCIVCVCVCVCVCMCVCAQSFSCVWLFATLWTVSNHAPLSMRLFRQGYCNGLLCPPPDQEIFSTKRLNLCLHVSCISSWNLYYWAQFALYIYSLFCIYCYFLETYVSGCYLW